MKADASAPAFFWFGVVCADCAVVGTGAWPKPVRHVAEVRVTGDHVFQISNA